MLPPEYFVQRGLLYCRENFLEPDECRRLRSEMDNAPARKADIQTAYGGLEQESSRKTLMAQVPEACDRDLRARLSALMPELEALVDLPLHRCQELSFLRYEVGHFFKAHRDALPHLPPQVEQRRVSVVIFLNAQQGEAAYSGGEFVVFVPPRPDSPQLVGLPVQVAPGMLLAFSSRLMHEVRPVSAGQRYSIVSWFS